MDFSVENLSLLDFIFDFQWNSNALSNFMGPNADLNWLTKVQISFDLENSWILWPKTPHTSVVSAVYSTLNDDSTVAHWHGWRQIWQLVVAPRVRTFVWRLAHSRLPTCDIFYNLNFGPQTHCVLCNLVPETTHHIFWDSCKTLSCWSNILNSLGLSLSSMNILSTGAWLVSHFNHWSDHQFVKAVIAFSLWLIWKARCNAIFKKISPNFNLIPTQARCLAKEYSKKPNKFLRDVYSCTLNPSVSIFSDASWINDTCNAGLGFLITIDNNNLLLAGSVAAPLDSPIQAEAAAMILALEECIKRRWWPSTIFSDCIGLLNLIKNFQISVAWHLDLEARRLRSLLHQLQNPNLEYIPREDNLVADALSKHAHLNPELSLFAKGMQLPFWFFNACSSMNIAP
ncbi:uncharacterized protein LOC120254337 [Dioscorea cayenensis subsp. rotundata]|uniref:Uncharacterized protein LOC120254337 n=1 Tax=Dioscorea cayennensis subsp. rotundata TaxID=55577 RepID=A0AB40AUA0_DIOCR|nr:uncharacterized protein LOC120254337 [Dioscorea cayenensis subsp. rotundata]